MILKGSQRGGASALAVHLLNDQDNDFIEVAAINGFMSDTVEGAFQEIEAVSRATSCKQFMFSLSLSPPEDAVVSEQDFNDAINTAMERLGLSGQPHVVIYHEKNGRRHAHLVISRVDADSMKAINLSFFKEKLCTLSRELYLTHGWELPVGHVDRAFSDPLNYSLEEHQTAKRAGRVPKATKKLLKDCWAHSDDATSFIAALQESGFVLCKGDKRAFVALDNAGKAYSLSRWLNVKTKHLIERLGEPETYPTIDEGKARIREQQFSAQADQENVHTFDDPLVLSIKNKIEQLQSQKSNLLVQHKAEREALKRSHEAQHVQKIKEFQSSRTRLRDLWNLVTGKRQEIITQRQSILADLRQSQELEFLGLSNRQRISLREIRSQINELNRQLEAIDAQKAPSVDVPLYEKPADPDFLLHQRLIKKSPDHVLTVINDRQAEFTRNDVVKALSHYLSDPAELKAAIDSVMASPELIAFGSEQEETETRFTTKSFQKLEAGLFAKATVLANTKAYGVQTHHMKVAIKWQNTTLQQSVGATLSEEQCNAIEHVLNRRQLSCVIGLAGAGKSTMLSAAKKAWTRQGYHVLGGSLAGKAADGLQNASNIPSRTLASWVHGWKHGRNELKAGDVLVIDEAGMVGSKLLSTITDHVQKQGAKLVLVGDPDQLQPINAGTPFREIAKSVGYAELTEIRRQKHDWQKQASLDLARGDTAKALKTYQEHGCIETAANHHDAIAALVEDYIVDLEMHGNGKSRLALAHSRRDVFAINQAIRAARKSASDLVNEHSYKTAHGERSFAAGDRIVFTLNDANLGIRNGMFGTVQSAGKGKLTVILDGCSADNEQRQLTIDIKRYKSIDHGYATTIHKSQGATVDQTFVLQSKSMDDHLKYVAMTRHRRSLNYYQYNNVQKSNSISSSFDINPELEVEI